MPGVELILAANRCAQAIEVHALNFPAADHHCGDVTKADLTRFPRADLFCGVAHWFSLAVRRPVRRALRRAGHGES